MCPVSRGPKASERQLQWYQYSNSILALTGFYHYLLLVSCSLRSKCADSYIRVLVDILDELSQGYYDKCEVHAY